MIVCTWRMYADSIDQAQAIPTLELKALLTGKRQGWLDYSSGVDAQSEELFRRCSSGK